MAAVDLNDDVVQLKLNEEVDFDFYSETATDGEKDYEFEAEHDLFCIIIENTATTDDVDITIKAGDYWQEDNEEYVPLEFTVGTTSSKAVGPLESAKYLNEDGKIEFNADMDGTTDDVDDLDIAVIFMPAFGVSRA